jgi:beta-aspartyl-peptidase (threonine type)
MRALGVFLTVLAMAAASAAQAAQPKWALVLHGGAGGIDRDDLSAEQEKAYRKALGEAAEAGAKVLRRGGSALDAVEAAVEVLEDDPLFNAGRGAVFTAEGRNELDASIMDGKTLSAGAVAGVTRTKNPIALSRSDLARSALSAPRGFLGIGRSALASARSSERQRRSV